MAQQRTPLSAMAGLPGAVPKGEAVPAAEAAVAPVVQVPTAREEEAPGGRFQMGLRLDLNRRNALRRVAFDEETTVQRILEQLIDRFLEERGARKGRAA